MSGELILGWLVGAQRREMDEWVHKKKLIVVIMLMLLIRRMNHIESHVTNLSTSQNQMQNTVSHFFLTCSRLS